MVSFRPPTHPDPDYPQLLALWNGRQVGMVLENTTVSSEYRWEFRGIVGRETRAIDRSLLGLAEKIKRFHETWESHESSVKGFIAARNLRLELP